MSDFDDDGLEPIDTAPMQESDDGLDVIALDYEQKSADPRGDERRDS